APDDLHARLARAVRDRQGRAGGGRRAHSRSGAADDPIRGRRRRRRAARRHDHHAAAAATAMSHPAYETPRQVTPLAAVVLASNPSPMTLEGTNTWLLRAPGHDSAVVVDP